MPAISATRAIYPNDHDTPVGTLHRDRQVLERTWRAPELAGREELLRTLATRVLSGAHAGPAKVPVADVRSARPPRSSREVTKRRTTPGPTRRAWVG